MDTRIVDLLDELLAYNKRQTELLEQIVLERNKAAENNAATIAQILGSLPVFNKMGIDQAMIEKILSSNSK